MTESGQDAVGVLRWGLRRYRLLFLACLVFGAVVAPYAADQLDQPAEAEALIIAQRLDMSLTALPRYGEAVFDNGQVAGAVAPLLGSDVPPKDIVPDHVSLVADQDSIVFHVVGHDPDPQKAADVANTAATTFLQALNVPGAGVGAFQLMSEAEPHAAPAKGLKRMIAFPVGIASGLVLGLAAISLLLAARRPVIDAAGVEEATGVTGLGTVTVPRTAQGQFARPDQFPGLIPVCRRLLRLETPTVVLVSRARERRLRAQVSVALAGILMRVREVAFTGPPDLREAVEVARTALGPDAARRSVPGGGGGDGRAGLTVIDSADPLDLVQPPELTAAVLVAQEGISSAALRAAVVENLGGSAKARVLLVKRGRRARNVSPARPNPEETAPVEEVVLGR
jgi:capsular polysaccharide biosynthesis protein